MIVEVKDFIIIMVIFYDVIRLIIIYIIICNVIDISYSLKVVLIGVVYVGLVDLLSFFGIME